MFNEIRRGFYASLPLMLGFTPLAMILGAQASQQGQTALTAYLMTAINLAGGSEFAAVSLWQHPVPPILMIVISTFLINSRHIILGATLAPYVRQESGLHLFFLYFVMCDETWALSMQEMERRSAQNLGFNFVYHMSVGVCLWADWSLSAFLGAYIGSSLGDLGGYGFDVALPATFIGLTIAMRPKYEFKKYLPIAISFAASALCALYLDPTYSVGMGAVCGLSTAYIIQVIKEKTDPNFKEGELKEVDLSSHTSGAKSTCHDCSLVATIESSSQVSLNDEIATPNADIKAAPPSSSESQLRSKRSPDANQSLVQNALSESSQDAPDLAFATTKHGN